MYFLRSEPHKEDLKTQGGGKHDKKQEQMIP